MKFKLLVIITVAFCLRLEAQDIHFSQFHASPLSLNPSYTGNFDGDWRFTNNYRSQWRALSIPFRTISVGFDRQFYIFSQHFSGGIYILNDKSGPAGLILNRVLLSFAWHKEVSGNVWHAGLQGGISAKNYSLDQLTFPNQYDINAGAFNSQMTNGEELAENILYPDVNVGIGWSRKMGNIEPFLGLAAFHINYPKESFQPENNHLPPRLVGNFGVNYRFASQWQLSLHGLWMRHSHASDFCNGLELTYSFPGEPMFLENVFIGGFIRNDLTTSFDAAIIEAGLTVRRFRIGVSYDMNMSDLEVATNHRGALELSLIFISKSTVPRKITLPCDRI